MNAGAIISGRPDGPSYVLIHGLGESHRAWDRVRTQLEQHGRVTAITIGRSGSIEDECDTIAPLIDRPSVVVGLSRGGLVATAIAERHPSLVTRLVLFCTPWSQGSRLGARRTSERALAVPVLDSVAWALAAGKPTRRALATAFAPRTPVPDQFVTDLRSRGRKDFVLSSRAIDDYLDRSPLIDRLDRARIDTHLIFGTMDARIAPIPDTVAHAPHLRISLLAGVGHTPPWEAPDQAVELIKDDDYEVLDDSCRSREFSIHDQK